MGRLRGLTVTVRTQVFVTMEVMFYTLCDVSDSATPWTIQSMEFSRPESWSGQPFPSPGDLPNPGIEPRSPTLQVDSLQLSHQGSHTLTVSGQIFWLYCCAVVLYVVTTEGKPVQDRWDLSIVSYKCMGFYTYFQMKGVNLKRAAVYEYMQQHE